MCKYFPKNWRKKHDLPTAIIIFTHYMKHYWIRQFFCCLLLLFFICENRIHNMKYKNNLSFHFSSNLFLVVLFYIDKNEKNKKQKNSINIFSMNRRLCFPVSFQKVNYKTVISLHLLFW